jgi:hypothetical protein
MMQSTSPRAGIASKASASMSVALPNSLVRIAELPMVTPFTIGESGTDARGMFNAEGETCSVFQSMGYPVARSHVMIDSAS